MFRDEKIRLETVIDGLSLARGQLLKPGDMRLYDPFVCPSISKNCIYMSCGTLLKKGGL